VCSNFVSSRNETSLGVSQTSLATPTSLLRSKNFTNQVKLLTQ